MNGYLITATAAVLCLCAAATGCSRSGRSSSEARTKETQTMLTADQAKQAVLELIRSHIDTFIGSPDPGKLAELPLEDRGEGKYAFGAFVVDLPNRRYSADIGHDAPELYSYTGSFARQDGRWIASDPEVTRFHQPLK
jgi:hypothetical protein